MNDLDIKTLINSAVDAELAGHRTAPPFDRAALADRPGAAHTLRLWSAPLLAASVAVLLAVGAMLAITLSRGQNHVRTPAGPAPSPSASPSLSVSRSVSTDEARAAREYAEAVAAAVPDPSKLAGVTVSAISAADAVRLKNGSAVRADASKIANPQPGKTYSFTMSYLLGPGERVAVVSMELRDVASGSCPPSFLARPAHSYRIRCQVTFLAGVIGKATLTGRTSAMIGSGTVNLTDPAKLPGSGSLSPQDEQAARKYSDALASAPEASKVAGVSDRPATADELRRGQGVGSLDSPVLAPERGRSYPVTLIYTPASDGPAIAVLSIRFEDVTTGRCPRAFRTRPGHSYLIRCQVTFRTGAVGKAYYTLIGPHETNTVGKTISNP